MNFRLRVGRSIILMSLRPGAPYEDRVEDEGRVLICEGHDVAKTPIGPQPKEVDQPDRNPNGSLTQKRIVCRSGPEIQAGGVSRSGQGLRENSSRYLGLQRPFQISGLLD
jgi:hypothetical protein